MWCPSLAESHRESSRALFWLRHMHGACRHVYTCPISPIFRQRLRQALVPYTPIFTFEIFDESGKASAANGVMLAPSERQRVSLPFFWNCICIFRENQSKNGPVSGARFRTQNGTAVLRLVRITIRGRKMAPFRGRVLGPAVPKIWNPRRLKHARTISLSGRR